MVSDRTFKIVTSSQVADIFWTLEAKYPTYLVGGAVRDALMDIEAHDVDIATKARPEQIIELFSGTRMNKLLNCSVPKYKVNQVGASFGVVLVNGIEIATFRGDDYHGAGAKDVTISYVDTIEEDLARRDFTMNAMAVSGDGDLIDPFGGVDDIKSGVVKFVGDPYARIDEDPNRILRAFRFCAVLDFELNCDTKYAIIHRQEKVKMIANERIRTEILKTLASVKRASAFFMLMEQCEVLQHIMPELVKGIGHDHGNHHMEDVWSHNMIAGDAISVDYPLLKLAGYLHDIGKPASFDPELGTFYEHQHFGADIVRDMLTELKFSNEEIRYVTNLVLVHMDGTTTMSAKASRRLTNKLGAYEIPWRDYLRLRISDRTGNLNRANFTISEIKKYIKAFTETKEMPMSVNDLVLRGGEIIKMFGLEPSPIVGKIQRELLKYVIDNGDVYNRISTFVTLIEREFQLVPVNID